MIMLMSVLVTERRQSLLIGRQLAIKDWHLIVAEDRGHSIFCNGGSPSSAILARRGTVFALAVTHSRSRRVKYCVVAGKTTSFVWIESSPTAMREEEVKKTIS